MKLNMLILVAALVAAGAALCAVAYRVTHRKEVAE